MKSFNSVFTGAVCAAAMLAAGSASAADSQTMAVSAKVLSVCKFTSSAYTMTFTDISPESTTDVTKPTVIGYKCTKNTAAAAITFDGGATGSSVLLAGTATPANTLPVSLAWTTPTAPASGFGSGSTALTFTVTGTITAANFSNMPADTYTKDVTVAITP